MKYILWCLLLGGTCTFGQTAADLQKENEAVTGNPYLFKDWSDGIVRFSSGRVMNQFKLKFDCFKNQLLLQFNGSTFVAESKVQEFVLYPKKSKAQDSLVFRKGFPATEKASEHTYYQVLFQDKVALLRLFFRSIIEERQLVVNGRAGRRLEEGEQYYLLQNGIMTPLPANKNELPEKFTDKKDMLTAFIASQQLKMHTAEEFVQVVKKYNESL